MAKSQWLKRGIYDEDQPPSGAVFCCSDFGCSSSLVAAGRSRRRSRLWTSSGFACCGTFRRSGQDSASHNVGQTLRSTQAGRPSPFFCRCLRSGADPDRRHGLPRRWQRSARHDHSDVAVVYYGRRASSSSRRTHRYARVGWILHRECRAQHGFCTGDLLSGDLPSE